MSSIPADWSGRRRRRRRGAQKHCSSDGVLCECVFHLLSRSILSLCSSCAQILLLSQLEREKDSYVFPSDVHYQQSRLWSIILRLRSPASFSKKTFLLDYINDVDISSRLCVCSDIMREMFCLTTTKREREIEHPLIKCGTSCSRRPNTSSLNTYKRILSTEKQQTRALASCD